MPFTQGHALLIGVGTYANISGWNVPKTATDAQALAEVLKNPTFCGYPESQVTLLTDAQATRQGLLDALEQLATSVGERDTFLFFFSGHGDHDAQRRYYLTTHDTRLEQGRIVPGSALSQGELLPRLRAIKAKRVLLVLNACFSGDLVEPGTLGEAAALGEGETLGSMLTEEEATAMLGSGEGRVIITACREQQRSYVGKGSELTIFAEELVNRLKGRGVPPQKGFISVFDLYTALFNNVQESVQDAERVTPSVFQKYGAQEPELTIIKGVGPFAVALHRGGETLGAEEDDMIEGAAPMLDSVRRASKADAQAAYNFQIQIQNTSTSGGLVGSVGGNVEGGIGNTTTNTAIGQGGIAGNSGSINQTFGDSVQGNNSQDVITASGQGAIGKVEGSVSQQFGDVVHGDRVGGDKVGGDKITVGSISGDSTVAIGRGATSFGRPGISGSQVQLASAFRAIYERHAGDPLAGAIRSVGSAIEREAAKGSAANRTLLQTLVGSLDFAPAAKAEVERVLREVGLL
jgi:hypothetical protein